MVDKVPSSSSSSFNEPKAPKNPFNFTREEYEVLTRNLSTSVPNEHSEYEEIELVEGCTLYDLYRQPRAPMMDPTVKRTFSVRSLNADLLCPICLGIVRDTMVVMECLHRFCRQCIETCLRACKNECPSCRINIPSRRSLRPDHNFDALIRTIYPKLEKFEQDEDQRIAENNRVVHFNNALTKSFKVGLEKQRMSKKKTNEPSEQTTSTTTTTTTITNATTNAISSSSTSSSRASSSSSQSNTHTKRFSTMTSPSTFNNTTNNRPTPATPSSSTTSVATRPTACLTPSAIVSPGLSDGNSTTTPSSDSTTSSAGSKAKAEEIEIKASKRHKTNEPESTPTNRTTNDSTSTLSISNSNSSHGRTVTASSSTSTASTLSNTSANNGKTTTTTPSPAFSSTTTTTTTTSSTTTVVATEAVTEAAEEAGDKVNLRVTRHPEDLNSPQLMRTLFQTFSRLRIRHLKKYLCTLLPGKNSKQMKIILSSRNVTVSGMSKMAEQNGIPLGPHRKKLLFDQELNDKMTLKNVFDQFDQGYQWELQLYYHFDENIVNSMIELHMMDDALEPLKPLE